MMNSKKQSGLSKKKAAPKKTTIKSGTDSKSKPLAIPAKSELKAVRVKNRKEKAKDQEKKKVNETSSMPTYKKTTEKSKRKRIIKKMPVVEEKKDKQPVLQTDQDLKVKKDNQKSSLDQLEINQKIKTKSPEGINTILKERAKDLAEEPKQEEVGEGQLELVEFILAYEKYGIESSFVREVYPLKEFTPVPCTPSFIFGITNVRGKLISVMDIKEFFGLPSKGLTDLNRTIILRTPQMEVGILADAIVGVRMVSLTEIQSSLPTLTDRRSEYLRGVTQDRLVILDIQKILADPRILINEAVDI